MDKVEKMVYLDEAANILGLPIEAMTKIVDGKYLRVLTDYTNGKQFTYNAWIQKAKAMMKPQQQTAPLTVKAPIYRLGAMMG